MSRIMPALADGRCFTSYLASCQYDNTLQSKFQQQSAPEFRSFLQNNALAAQEETRKLHVCAFATDRLSVGPALPPAYYTAASVGDLK